ncbi:hypothetical protein IWZ01DRAFT_316470 [Phyllosticta capitalensis]
MRCREKRRAGRREKCRSCEDPTSLSRRLFLRRRVLGAKPLIPQEQVSVAKLLGISFPATPPHLRHPQRDTRSSHAPHTCPSVPLSLCHSRGGPQGGVYQNRSHLLTPRSPLRAWEKESSPKTSSRYIIVWSPSPVHFPNPEIALQRDRSATSGTDAMMKHHHISSPFDSVRIGCRAARGPGRLQHVAWCLIVWGRSFCWLAARRVLDQAVCRRLQHVNTGATPTGENLAGARGFCAWASLAFRAL